MTKRPFTLMRGLGIFVGLLFVVTAPFVAKGEGLAYDRIGQIVVTVMLGLIFIGYGVTGFSRLPKTSSSSVRLLRLASSAALCLAGGLYLLFIRHGSVVSQIVGAVLILSAAPAIWVAYAIYKSKPAA